MIMLAECVLPLCPLVPIRPLALRRRQPQCHELRISVPLGSSAGAGAEFASAPLNSLSLNTPAELGTLFPRARPPGSTLNLMISGRLITGKQDDLFIASHRPSEAEFAASPVAPCSRLTGSSRCIWLWRARSCSQSCGLVCPRWLGAWTTSTRSGGDTTSHLPFFAVHAGAAVVRHVMSDGSGLASRLAGAVPAFGDRQGANFRHSGN